MKIVIVLMPLAGSVLHGGRRNHVDGCQSTENAQEANRRQAANLRLESREDAKASPLEATQKFDIFSLYAGSKHL
jgi:hypothetical protein